MEANQTARKSEREISHRRLRVMQIETMIAEFERKCIELGHEIDVEEKRAQIFDPNHFAYPTYATAVRERRAKLQRSTGALRTELHRLIREANETVSDIENAA